jgi:hypothetical protein
MFSGHQFALGVVAPKIKGVEARQSWQQSLRRNDLALGFCQQQDRLKVVSDYLYVRDAMYSSYTSILLVVVTHCCLHSRYQQAEIGRAGTSRHQLLTESDLGR